MPSMKTRLGPRFKRLWIAAILQLTVLACVGIAWPAFSLDEQLLDAASRGDLELVKTLLRKGADVNSKDEDGDTALSLAKTRRHDAVAQYLRAQGAK